MLTANFHFDFFYPNRERPELFVTAVDRGYGFMRYNQEGKVVSHFTINREIVESRIAATGYEGEDAMAIKIFRNFLFRFS